jgi:hypothetical protein
MDRAFASGASGSPPTAPASPSVGYATAGNPGTGTPATKPGPWWYHMITEEQRAVVVAAGITPDQTSTTQLRDAILALIAAGAANDYKASVRVATTANIASLVGGAPDTVDGITLVLGDRVLVKDQSTGAQNGIYTVTTLGTGANGTWTRATDADAAGELTIGALVPVEVGTANADSLWMLTTDGTITIGTTALTFTKQGGSTAATGFRNKIINGAMVIDQRNAGASQNFTAGGALAYCVDRWYGYCTGANITGQQVAGPIANTYRYQFVGAVSNTGFGFGTRLEAVNTAMMAGSAATLSAKIKSSALTSVTWSAYYASTKDAFGTLASPTRTLIATGSFTITASEATYSAPISIPGAATTGIEIVFSAGAMVSGQTLTIGDIQLEQGSTASSFENLPISLQLSTCQRYFLKRLSVASGGYFQGVSGTLTTNAANFPEEMRAAPTFGTSLTYGGFGTGWGTSGLTATGFTHGNGSTAGGYANVYGTITDINAEL